MNLSGLVQTHTAHWAPAAKRSKHPQNSSPTARSSRDQDLISRPDTDVLQKALKKARLALESTGTSQGNATLQSQLRKGREALDAAISAAGPICGMYNLSMLCANADIPLSEAVQGASDGNVATPSGGAHEQSRMLVFQRGDSVVTAHAPLMARLGGVIEATLDGKHGFTASRVIDTSVEPWSNCCLDSIRLVIKAAYVGIDAHITRALGVQSIRELSALIELMKYMVSFKNGPSAAKPSILKELHAACNKAIIAAVHADKCLKTADEDSEESDSETA